MQLLYLLAFMRLPRDSRCPARDKIAQVHRKWATKMRKAKMPSKMLEKCQFSHGIGRIGAWCHWRPDGFIIGWRTLGGPQPESSQSMRSPAPLVLAK